MLETCAECKMVKQRIRWIQFISYQLRLHRLILKKIAQRIMTVHPMLCTQEMDTVCSTLLKT